MTEPGDLNDHGRQGEVSVKMLTKVEVSRKA